LNWAALQTPISDFAPSFESFVPLWFNHLARGALGGEEIRSPDFLVAPRRRA
jgi:hypothetical protein